MVSKVCWMDLVTQSGASTKNRVTTFRKEIDQNVENAYY
jgi:hypothetical protein